jgi:hypothetical protein
MKKLFAILLFLLVPALSQSDDAQFDKVIREDLTKWARANIPAFSSECRIGKFAKGHKNGKAILVLPIGEKEGLFIESYENAVANYATLELRDGKFQIEVAQGGVYTINRLGHLIDELMTYPFQLVRADKIEGLLISRPKKVCVEKLPD